MENEDDGLMSEHVHPLVHPWSGDCWAVGLVLGNTRHAPTIFDALDCYNHD